MNDRDIENHVRAALYTVAPDIEGEPLAADKRYRDQFEFDSMDFLRYVIELHRRTGVDVPEQDYPLIETLAGSVAYLRGRGL